jgi:hypothetical protein
LREDSEQITQDPVMAEKVPVWMNTAAQVATGNRTMVLEDGPDLMNSDEDDSVKEEHGEVLTGMYTAEMDPNLGPQKLTTAQVAVQKAAAQALKALEAQKVPPRSQSPMGGSSDEDEPTGSEWIWSQTPKQVFQRSGTNRRFKSRDSTGSSLLDTSRKCTPQSEGSINVPTDTLPDLKKGKKSSVPAPKKGAGKKAADKPADPEATQPMKTRSVSRAGSLRPGVGGSWQKDTCVASSHPSKT